MAVYERVSAFGFSLQGETYRYFVVGDTRKPVIVLLPGFSGRHSDLFSLASSLQGSYCVVIVEWAGWEENPIRNPRVVHGYVSYLHQLLDFLGLHSVVLVGHCLGGLVALEFALRYPKRVSELFLVSLPYLGPLWMSPVYVGLSAVAWGLPSVLRPVVLGMKRGVLALPVDFWAFPVGGGKHKLGRVRRHLLDQGSHAEQVIEKQWLSFVQFGFGRVVKLRMPVHFIHGGKDVLTHPREINRLRRRIPRATFEVLARVGHVFSGEQACGVAAIILGYLHVRKK